MSRTYLEPSWSVGWNGEGKAGVDVPDVEESAAAKDVVTPLVGAVDESTDKTANDQGDAHEEGGHDVGEREAGGEENRQEEEGESNEPLDVPHILQHKVSKAAFAPSITRNVPRSDGSRRCRGIRSRWGWNRGQTPWRSRQDWQW